MKKLPIINAKYWAFIISATTLGETGGDLISQSLNLGYASTSILLIGLFVLALLIELKTTIRHPALYWLVIIMASLAGNDYFRLCNANLGSGLWLGVATDSDGVIDYFLRLAQGNQACFGARCI